MYRTAVGGCVFTVFWKIYLICKYLFYLRKLLTSSNKTPFIIYNFLLKLSLCTKLFVKIESSEKIMSICHFLNLIRISSRA